MGKSSSSKAAPKKTPTKVMKTNKGKLNKAALDKLGTMGLEEKVKLAVEESTTPEEAAAHLKGTLTKVEHSKVWGQHNTFLKNNPEEAIEVAGKKDKGLAAALWFIQRKSPKFMNLSHAVAGKRSVQKCEQWLSEKQMQQKFSDEELQAHLTSGRVIYREDPMTRGVWQYKDQNDVTHMLEVDKTKTLTHGQDFDPDDEDQQLFDELFDKDFFCSSIF